MIDEELKQALFVAAGVGDLVTVNFTRSGMVIQFTNAAEVAAFLGLVDREKVSCEAFSSTLVGVTKRQ